MTSDILKELAWRGLIADSTDAEALGKQLDEPTTFYCGFDPTAPSLHIGNLVQILTMRRLQEAGHRPVALVGGATGLIGDPKQTGERTLNDEETVEEWTLRIEAQLRGLLSFTGPSAAHVVNNFTWTSKLNAIELLRDIGKHFPVNKMLDREAVAARLAGGGISYTEFSYQVLQANDYLYLFNEMDCQLQTGGSDQWGNLTAGVDLVRRVTGEHVHALTTPLLVKSDGQKFGKTESGTIWIDAERTSAYDFYQFWINTEDSDVGRWLRVFSFRSRSAIEELEAAVVERPHAREGQRALAQELTTLLHGAAATEAVVAASAALFGRGEFGDADPTTLAAALAQTPKFELTNADLVDGQVSIVTLFASSGLVTGLSAARRMIGEGGAYVNNVRVADVNQTVSKTDLLHERWLVLRKGKRNLAAVEASVLARDESVTAL